MKKLQFKVSITAPVTKIYDFMLGITNKSTYEQWTALFNPTSTYEGSWDKGSKMLFIGVDEKGEKRRHGFQDSYKRSQPICFYSTLWAFKSG